MHPRNLDWRESIRSHRALGAFSLAVFLCTFLRPLESRAAAPEAVGPFIERDFPFVQTCVELAAAAPKSKLEKQVVVRGILLLPQGPFCVLFDSELLRVAAIWRTSEGMPPIHFASMSQVSYAEPHRKAGNTLPTPIQAPFVFTRSAPGISTHPNDLLSDPRPKWTHHDFGRGPLPISLGRFDGVELQQNTTRVRYHVGNTAITEWFETRGHSVVRHLEVAPHPEDLHLALADGSTDSGELEVEHHRARGDALVVESLSPEIFFERDASLLRARIASAATTQSLTLVYTPRDVEGPAERRSTTNPQPNPSDSIPVGAAHRRWPQVLHSTAQLAFAESNGLSCDSIGLPVSNPWKRRVRPADIAFLNPDRGAVVTYDGDVWLVDGLSEKALKNVTWQRFASGLNEPLSIAAVSGTLQVYSRNGLVRLHDRDGNGEADWYENFSDAWAQSSSSRAFPLDMAVASDGTTLISQGGIGRGSPFSGSITRISADGRHTEIVSKRAREPYLALHPTTALITSTDQQGDFIPSSACYLVQPCADFGYGEEHPKQLTPPLAWIPHHEDNSCASQVWLTGKSFGPLSGKLLHLSYGRGVPLLICPDLDAPIPQGAVIPLGLPTNLPLLHARMHPSEGSLFAAGFQIYDSRTTTNWGLVRLRPHPKSLKSPIQAQCVQDGVLLTFAQPLDPASVQQEAILAASWNYRRSKAYGSGRFKGNGEAGIDPVPFGQVLLSRDRRSIFIHLPDLQPAMQLAITYQVRLRTGEATQGNVYFTVHQPGSAPLDPTAFPNVDLSRSLAVTRLPKAEPPTKQRGRELSVSMGCVACHSTDGSTEGKTGPTWKGLFGKDRFFADGSMESANEFYLRTSILEPEKKVVAGYHAGMASYKGILSEDQIDSIILFIQSLR